MLKKKRCRRVQQMAVLLTGLMIFLHMGTVTALAQEENTLKVAFPELSGISETDEYGNHRGLLVDYLNEIAKYTGWEYEYIPCDGNELVTNFLNGEYDLMGGSFYQPGFEKYFAYPEYSTGRSRAALLCNRDDDRLLGYNLASLNGKTIGVYDRAADKIRYLNEFLKSNDLSCNLRYYTAADMGDDGNLYSQLRNGEVDMILGNELEIGGEFRMVTSFQAQPYYIVTTVGNTEVLDGLNMSLQYILEATPNFAENVYNANFPDVKYTDIQLNEQELKYIKEKNTVKVAIPENCHPIYCRESVIAHHEGMLSEMLKEIGSFSGLRFTYVYTKTYEESIQMVLDGKADILGAYFGTEEEAFSKGLALSQSYIDLGNMVLKNKFANYPGENSVCGIITGFTLPPNFETEKIRSYDKTSELLAAVNEGDVDFIYGISAMLEQEMQKYRYMNIVPITQMSVNTETSFAIARPIEPELLTILNKSISNIATEKKADMLNRNLVSVDYNRLSFQEMLYANPVASILIFGCVLLLIMAVVLLIVKNKMKSQIMQSQLEAAEAKSMAKSEFLSKMSHEIRTPMNAIVGLTDLICMEYEITPEVEEKLEKIRSSSRYMRSLINDILDMSRIENGRMELEQKDFSLTYMLDEIREMMEPQAEQKGLKFSIVCKIGREWLIGDPLRLRQILTNLLSNAIKFTMPGDSVTLTVEETDCDGQTTEYRFSVKDTGEGIPKEDQERIFGSFEQLKSSVSSSAGTGLGLPISRSMAELMGGSIQVESKPGEGSEFYMTIRFKHGSEMLCIQAENSPQERNLKGTKILLAEDNDLNAEIVQELLTIQGIEVSRAINGQETVDIFMNSQLGEFQAILMDIQMPVKDGNEAAREIRGSGREDADVPIIAMTANSFKEDEQMARDAGMNGFVPKPINIGQLFSLLRDIL